VKAVWLRLRTDLLARWGSWTLIAVLIGVGGTAALTAAAGARRTDTAYARFLASSGASDVAVSAVTTGLPSYYAALAKLPGVRALGVIAGRMYRPDGADESVIDQATARLLHLPIGSSLTIAAYTQQPDPTNAVHLPMRVVGIVTDRTKVVVLSKFDGQPHIYVTPRVLGQLGRAYFGFVGVYVRLATGTSAEAFGRQAEALAAQYS
jgi:hypothetical protein